MNYLAHLHLSGDSGGFRIGNLIGDFVKGRIDDALDVEIARGIKTHRKIDAYSDRHEKFSQSRRLISRPRRRFAGIIVDMSFDHFLAKNWPEYSGIDLTEFIDDTYRLLLNNTDILPERFRHILPVMVEEDWLGSYRTLDGIERSLNGISRRFKLRFGRDNNLCGAIDEVENNYKQLELNFKAFYPDLITFAEGCRTNPGGS